MVSAGVPSVSLWFFVFVGLDWLRCTAEHSPLDEKLRFPLLVHEKGPERSSRHWNCICYHESRYFRTSKFLVSRLGSRHLLWTAQLKLFMHLGCGAQDSPLVWWTRFTSCVVGKLHTLAASSLLLENMNRTIQFDILGILWYELVKLWYSLIYLFTHDIVDIFWSGGYPSC